MTKHILHNIALLATGDEIVSGDLVNTNAATIANLLEQYRFQVSCHLSVRDNLKDMIQALHWLMRSNRIIITIGGLGPTTDDLTRQAVSSVSHKKLVFNPAVWERIQESFARHQRPCPEINKRQAYFHEGAIIWNNTNGTAQASVFSITSHSFIQLPGPPKECLPLVEKKLIPFLNSQELKKAPMRHTRMLLGAGESPIAQMLEPLCAQLPLTLAFRASPPYLEVKFFTYTRNLDLTTIDSALAPWCIAHRRVHCQSLFERHLDNLTPSCPFYIKKHNTSNTTCLKWLNTARNIRTPPTHTPIWKNACVSVYSHPPSKTLTTFFGNRRARLALALGDTKKNNILADEWLCYTWLTWLRCFPKPQKTLLKPKINNTLLQNIL